MARRVDFKILIIGASGVFGSRLVRLLALESGVSLCLAGRNQDALSQLCAELSGGAAGSAKLATLMLDRDVLRPCDVARFDVVVDAAGPFQSSQENVPKACLKAKTAYIDLADGREWLANFPQWDGAAKAEGIAMISGASSIPALSHAVLDHLTRGWSAVESVNIGIFPGNRAPRGRSVMEAILSYVGQPVRVFRGGKWQVGYGWGQTHIVRIPGVGRRWASLCDTPEQDLLVERYAPTQSGEFFAGLELSLLHLGLAALSQLVRFKMLRSLRPFAAPLHWLAERFISFGGDQGAMMVQATGYWKGGDAAEMAEQGAGGTAQKMPSEKTPAQKVPSEKMSTQKVPTQKMPAQKVSAHWVLRAKGNRGPNVPILAAAALLRKMRDGCPLPTGAMACSGILTLDDFQEDFARLGIETEASEQTVE